MQEGKGSVRPNSISVRHAIRDLYARVDSVATEADPAPWFEVTRFLIDMFGDGDEPGYVRRQKLSDRSKRLMAGALLSGELRAHFSDHLESRDVPAWAWVGAEQGETLWMLGRLTLPSLLPDEWQRWSGLPMFIDQGQFEAWIERTDVTSVEGLTQLPAPFDEGTRPRFLTFREPPDRPFITLSEAVSWIAFRLSLHSERLINAIDSAELGNPDETQFKLERAIADLASLASGQKIGARGKYKPSSLEDDSSSLTENIDPVRFHDFAQFDAFADALRYGTGLTRINGSAVSQIMVSKRRDLIVRVTVNRADLLKHFPANVDPIRKSLGLSTGAAETECKEWLVAAFSGDPEKKRSKKSFRQDALSLFAGRLSVRGFNRAWDAIAPSADRSKPGRKS